MVRKKEILLVNLILVVIFVSANVLAYDTSITVSTMANHNVTIKILDSLADESSENLLERFEENSGENGKVTITHTSSKSLIDIFIMVRKNGKILKVDGNSYHKEIKHPAGKSFSLTWIPETSTNSEEQTTEENKTEELPALGESEETEENVEETSTEETETSGITGEVVSEENENNENKGIPNIVYFIVIGVLLASFIVFLVVKGVLKSKPKNIKVRKYSDLKKEHEELKDKKDGIKEEAEDKQDEIGDKDLSEAEKRLQQAQAEVEKFKKMREVEEKIKKTEEELRRLKGESGRSSENQQ